MDIKNVITINKRFVIIMLSVIGIALLSSYSYALYQVNFIKHNVVVLQTASNLTITTTIDDTNSNSFTLPASGNKTVVVHLDTNGITSAMAYKMWYEVTSGYGTFTVTSNETFTNNKVEGIMQPYERTNNEKITGKNITLTFTNNSANALTISLGAIGGFEKTGATLTTEEELILNSSITIAPRYSASELIANLKSTKLTSNNSITETDNNQTITYLSGCSKYYYDQYVSYCTSANLIDFNYVWYSGRMWRITSINETTGKIKLITQEPQTSIAWHDSSPSFEGSYVKQFLNDEFYDTLYQPTNFIDTSVLWDVTTTTSVSTKLSNPTVTSNVGLLNSYEYYKSYEKVGNSSYGYLNIGQNWWLLNPSSESYVWSVDEKGNFPFNGSSYIPRSVRPSINLLSIVNFTGTGTEDDPYRLVGDMEVGEIGSSLKDRQVGEYVKLKNGANEQIFRIIGFENNTTKLIALDYANDGNTRVFATANSSGNGTIFGEGNTVGDSSNQTWYYYLTNTYITDLKTKYDTGASSMFTTGEYYLGINADNPSDTRNYYNYRTSICASNGDLSNNCTKSRSKALEAGLLRYGEMFAAQHGIGYNAKTSKWNTKTMWLMTRRTASYMWRVFNSSVGSDDSPTYAYVARPSINLSSGVKILSGSGTELDPYVVGL